MSSICEEQAKCNNMLMDVGGILNYLHDKRTQIFTLVSSKTGKRFTYRVQYGAHKTYIISLLTGDDNTADYTRIGRGYVHGYNKDKTYDDLYIFNELSMAQSIMAIKLLIENPQRYLSLGGEFWVPARCRVCGRLLTTPQAIIDGVGHRCKNKAHENLNKYMNKFRMEDI